MEGRPRLALSLALAAAALPGVKADSGSLPTWLAYVTGGLLVIIIVYYCCRRARFDENLQQPLLGGCGLIVMAGKVGATG